MLEKAWNDIVNADEKARPRAIYRAAKIYDEVILTQRPVSEDAFNFLVKVVSSEAASKSKGIEHFLLEISSDFVKYTSDQRAILLDVIAKYASSYSDYMAKHNFGDLIGRSYPPEVAYNFLLKLLREDPAAKTVVFVGFDVLSMQIPESDPLHRKIMFEWNKILDEENNGKAQAKE